MSSQSDEEREIRGRIAKAEWDREEVSDSIRQRLNGTFFKRGIRLGFGDQGISDLERREKDDIRVRDAAIADLAELEQESGEG